MSILVGRFFSLNWTNLVLRCWHVSKCVPREFKQKGTNKNIKIDPYKHKERFLKWKERVKDGIPNINKENSSIIIQYINDMEKGINITSSNVKGSRSYIRLNSLKERFI